MRRDGSGPNRRLTMLQHLSEFFPSPPFTLFRYVTFRSAGAAVTAFLLAMYLGPGVIRWLRSLKYQQDYQPKDLRDGARDSAAAAADAAKRGTPTMGGILIVMALDLATVLWARWVPLVLLTLLSSVILGGLGFYDDWLKVTRQNAAGAASKFKFIVQLALAAGVAGYLYVLPSTRELITDIQLPFFKSPVLTGVPLLGAVLTILTITGSSNAVNLTDGMDGLATGCVLITSIVFLVMTYVAGNVVFAKYLLVPHVRDAGELTVVVSALLGACLGFLWFNCHPAEVFMGDTGSLALGGALGLVAVLIHQPLVLLIAGGVFAAEAVSVMMQVGWFKYTRKRHGEGRRIFLMSPLHHHFRKLGWPESKIVTRFYIAAFLCAIAALSTLKIR
jgi:phospho-N-acetylmuramoyl-pentapeptide-transferase